MKIVFMGTPDFASVILESLLESRHEIVAVYSQPDKARGRSGKLVPTPVKALAVQKNLPVFTPERLKEEESVTQLKEFAPDVIVVAAYGQILSKEILEIPTYGCMNVHASLLPRWRGAAPIQWSILSGDLQTGICIMQMNEGLDTGDVLMKEVVDIREDDTSDSLFDRLASGSGPLLLKALEAAEKGELHPEPQKEEEATYAKMLRKDMGKMDFTRKASELDCFVRGMNSWPGAFSYYGKKICKFWEAWVWNGNTSREPGDVITWETPGISEEIRGVLKEKKSFGIQTGDGILIPKVLQLEGKKRMPTSDFMRGNAIEGYHFSDRI